MHWTPLQFRPIYKQRPWGGRALDGWGGRDLPPGGTIGESWELVDRDDDQSVVSKGAFAGKTLRWLMANHPRELLGGHLHTLKRFPLLIKLLDCRERLSLQVHPPARVAPELGGEPKTESWYILKASESATLMAGLRRGVTRESFEAALRGGDLAPLVHEFPVKHGDFIFIPSGRIHAIGAGLLILEVQQNSDTTYRVYDWGRVGLDGKPRELHIDESLRSIDFDDFEPQAKSWTRATGPLVKCAEFEVARHTHGSLRDIELKTFRLVYVLAGHGRIGGQPMNAQSLWLLPAALERAKVESEPGFEYFLIGMTA